MHVNNKTNVRSECSKHFNIVKYIPFFKDKGKES